MRTIVVSLLEEAGFFELLVFWAFCIAGPFSLWSRGREELASRYGSKRTGRLELVGAAIAGVVVVTFFAFFGIELLKATVRAGGVWFVGLLIASVVCVVALPMSVVGQHLRAARDQSSSRHLWIGLAGLLVMATIGGIIYLFLYSAVALGFAALALLAVVVGWFRHVLIPDVEG